MWIQQVQDDAGWKKLLAYYMDCLRAENRLDCLIGSKDIGRTCWFLPHIDGSFLPNTASFSISIQRHREEEIGRLQRFVLGDPCNDQPPGVCFGYPFFVDSHRSLIPLFYVDVSGRRLDTGVWLTSESPEVETNVAALREILAGDIEQAWSKLAELEAESGKMRFDRTLALFSSHLEQLSAKPVARLDRKQFDPQCLPHQVLVECPLLFYARANDSNRLVRDLGRLRTAHDWSALQPALRHLLTRSDGEPYPEAPERTGDPHPYVVPTNDRQRQAVAAAGQCPLTVVVAPPGIDKWQLILHVASDVVFKGETVLIASPNREIIDGVFERLSNEFDYPGVVRGDREFSQQMLTAMRQALIDVRAGNVVGRLERVRGEYEEIVGLIGEQGDPGALGRRLEQDQKACQTRLQDALEALPESIRAAVKRDRIHSEQDDGERLSAALSVLVGDVQKVSVQCQALAEKVRALLWTNQKDLVFLRKLEDMERRSGIVTSLRRPSIDLSSPSAIQAHISAWEHLLQALPLEYKVRQLQMEIGNAERRTQSQRESLSTDLSTALDDAVKKFDKRREQSLRRELDAIENEAREAAFHYRQLVVRVDHLKKRHEFIAHWLRGVATAPAGDSAHSRFEDILDRGFAIQDDVLKAHRLGVVRADMMRQLSLLRRDRDHQISKSQNLLARLDQEFIVVRAQVPAWLLSQVEAALAAADHQAWRDLATQLAKIEIWVARIEAGDLTFQERARGIVSHSWTVAHLQSKLNTLRASYGALFALGPIAEPPGRGAMFELWAEYVHTWNGFAQACALAVHRADAQQMLVSYQAQSEDEINARSAELQEIETRFADLLAGLPETVAGAMSGDAWFFEPIDEAVVRDLNVLRGQYRDLKAQYTDWAERLATLQKGRALPKELQSAIRALSPDKRRRSQGRESRAAPLAVLDLVSAWLSFSQVVEVECGLQPLRSSLAEIEKPLKALWASLPDGMRQELDWATAPHEDDDVLLPLQVHLSSLRAELVPQVEVWDRIRECVAASLHQNELKSRALGRALDKAREDPGYLSKLWDKTYERPEQLLVDLQMWQQVVQVWRLRGQRTRVRTQLKEYFSPDGAQLALEKLSERRRGLAARVLAEHWWRVAAELEPDVAQSIDQYLSTIEVSEEGGTDLVDVKWHAETHFGGVLKLFPVWLTADLSLQHIPVQAGLFDRVVIDEAGQLDIPSALPLLFRAKRIVVIGDGRPFSHNATLSDAINQRISERHAIGIGTRYDYKPHSLFDLAAHSVKDVPGQIVLDES